MSTADPSPGWEVREDAAAGREIRLYGPWNLLSLSRAGRRFRERLRELDARAADRWDLEGVTVLDSTGALLLWRLWGGRFPERVRWREEQRSWFRHLDALPPPEAPPPLRARDALVALGRSITNLFAHTAGILLLLGQLIVDFLYCLRHPRAFPWRGISATVYRAGAQSLLLLAFIGALVGVVLAYQMAGQLEQFGANQAIIGVVGLAFMRELGPFLTSVILVGRSGSSFTAGIGAMRVTEEIDALRAFGVSPTLRVVFPKVAGLTLATPLLVIWTDFWGMVGAVYVSQADLGVGYRMWIDQFPGAIPWSNYFIGFAKGILFGALIGVVSSYYGLRVQPNTRSLTEETTRAVVVGIALVIAIDGVLGILLSNVGLA